MASALRKVNESTYLYIPIRAFLISSCVSICFILLYVIIEHSPFKSQNHLNLSYLYRKSRFLLLHYPWLGNSFIQWIFTLCLTCASDCAGYSVHQKWQKTNKASSPVIRNLYSNCTYVYFVIWPKIRMFNSPLFFLTILNEIHVCQKIECKLSILMDVKLRGWWIRTNRYQQPLKIFVINSSDKMREFWIMIRNPLAYASFRYYRLWICLSQEG